jgi:hypothetical protein
MSYDVKYIGYLVLDIAVSRVPDYAEWIHELSINQAVDRL